MAKDKIRGITIELTADTAGILDGLKDIDKSLKTTESALKDVNKLLKFDPDNVTLLAQKQDYLTDAIGKTEDKLKEQKALLESMKAADNAGETVEQQKALEREIEATNQKLNTYQGELDKTTTALDKMGKEAKDSAEGFNDTSSAIMALAKSEAFSKITEDAQKLYEALMSCDAAADKFETSMAKVETLAHKGSALSDMATEIKNASAAIGVSSSDMAEAVYQAMSAGVASANAVQFATEASRLAIGGFTDTATAVDIVTTALNAYDLSMEDSTHIMDDLITTQNLGKTTVAELAQAMGKVIPTASAYNVNIDNLASAYAELTAKGIRTRETTTYLNAMFSELGNNEKEVNEILQELTGQTFGQYMAAGNSVGDVMKKLWEYADKDKEKFMGLWSTTQAGKAAFNLASDGGEKFNDILAQMGDNAGELDKAFDIMANTSEMLDARFNTAVENMQIAIGDALGPALDSLKEKGLEVLEPVTAFIEANPELVSAISAMIIGVTGVTTAVTACAAAVAILKLALGDITGIAAILGGAAIVGGLGGLAIAMDGATQSTEELRKSIKGTQDELAKTNSTYDKNISDVRSLATQIQTLNAQEKLSAEQKVELASAVEKWNSVVGENNQLIVDETGHIEDLNGVLADSIELAFKQYELAQNEERRAEILEEYAQAQENLIAAQERLNEVTETYNKLSEDSVESAYAWKGQIEEAQLAVDEATKAQKNLEDEYNALTNAINEATPAVEENAQAMEEIEGASAQAQADLEALAEAYGKAFESARSSLEGQREEFEKFNTNSKTSVSDIAESLQKQAEGMKEYAELIASAYDIMQQRDDAKGILAYYIEQGPEAAGELKNLVDAFNQGGDALKSFDEAAASFNEVNTMLDTLAQMQGAIESGYTEPMEWALEELERLGGEITTTQQGQYEEQQAQAEENRTKMTETATGTVTDMATAVTDNQSKLTDATQVMMEESHKRHFSVVMDEFQNLYKVNPSIFSEMQDIWDRYHNGSKMNLIVSGSVRSLMKRIFEDKGEPLYGRPTSKLTLLPFTTDVLKDILRDHNPDYNNEDLLCLYMITGGVAKYVELLMDARCHTKTKMLDYVFRQDSYFLSEGQDLVRQEFSDESATYFSILQLIAGGLTRRAEIDAAMQKDTGAFLQNLENNFNLIKRLKPVLSKPSGKTSAYEVCDQFLRFWFRFIHPYQSLVERQQLTLLRQNAADNYEQFTGRTLEQYYQQKFMETGRFSIAGNWWDRKGGNEIDLVALNEFEKTGVLGTIKRNPKKISISELEYKAKAMPSSDFGQYDLQMTGLSLKDM